MKRLLLTPIIVWFAIALLSAQTWRLQHGKGDRPVYMSAERLASLCADWNAINPGGFPPKDTDVLTVSLQQVVRGNACDAYILGYMDAEMGPTFGQNYHPVPVRLEGMKSVIDTFLKTVADHPEQQDFAASTVLDDVLRRAAAVQVPQRMRR